MQNCETGFKIQMQSFFLFHILLDDKFANVLFHAVCYPFGVGRCKYFHIGRASDSWSVSVGSQKVNHEKWRK